MLIISDSQSRYIESLEGGLSISMYGGTSADLDDVFYDLSPSGWDLTPVTLKISRSLSKSDLAVAILNFGVNDVRKLSERRQGHAEEELRTMLANETQNRNESVPTMLVFPSFPACPAPFAANNIQRPRAEKTEARMMIGLGLAVIPECQELFFVCACPTVFMIGQFSSVMCSGTG